MMAHLHHSSARRWWTTFALVVCCGCPAGMAENMILSERNVEAPFPYLPGGTRTWPVFRRRLPPGGRVRLTVRSRGSTVEGEGEIRFRGFAVSLSPQGRLTVTSAPGSQPETFELRVVVSLPEDRQESQSLQLRPAPPRRPLSYVADFGDDFIHLFFDPATGRYRPVRKAAFAQYFRRLQAQGIDRLILWLTPFPLAADPKNYKPEDWDRFEKQARALIESKAVRALLDRAAAKRTGWRRFTHWGWIRQLLALRLQRDFGKMLFDSALDHGIRLTISFRPFEGAVSKYYEIPTFDSDGRFLWGFLPLASPLVNYHPEEVCFAHYRTILEEMGRGECGRVGAIDVAGAKNGTAFVRRFRSHHDNLRVAAANFPPVQEDSLVLQRQPDGRFTVSRYRDIQRQAEAHNLELREVSVEATAEGVVRLTNLRVPTGYRYLLLSNPGNAGEALDFAARDPVTVRSQAGNRLGRLNVYWVLDDTPEGHVQTRIAGIPPDGEPYSEFNATEASRKFLADAPERIPLRNRTLVIDLGQPWSVEMMDFNQAAMRRNVVAELRSLLKHPAVDEVFLNTRSHTALPNRLDLAYAPRAAVHDGRLSHSAAASAQVEQITMGVPDEWQGTCQSSTDPRRWRYVRNREVAAGLRKLLLDLEQAFPTTRIRMVIPPREAAVRSLEDALSTLPRADGTPYGRAYLKTVLSSLNYIQTIGEGAAMIDLTGLRTEPVLFGLRGLLDPAPLDLLVDELVRDMSDNHGSRFRGPHSFFYEAQETLRYPDKEAARRRREEIIRTLLSRREQINEVILYEAVDWLYKLPLSDPELYGHEFLDRRPWRE